MYAWGQRPRLSEPLSLRPDDGMAVPDAAARPRPTPSCGASASCAEVHRAQPRRCATNCHPRGPRSAPRMIRILFCLLLMSSSAGLTEGLAQELPADLRRIIESAHE